MLQKRVHPRDANPYSLTTFRRRLKEVKEEKEMKKLRLLAKQLKNK